MAEKTLVIADDHPLLLKGLETALRAKGFRILGVAQDGSTALKLIDEHKPDIAILDIEMPHMDGLSVAKHCRDQGHATKFIMLSYHKEIEFVTRAKSLNLSGYLLKEDALEEIDACIREVIRGGAYYSKAFQVREIAAASSSLDRLDTLTPSEKKILRLIARNMSTRDIADSLFVSERTVEKHRSNIILKLELSGKPNGLTHWVLRHKHLLS